MSILAACIVFGAGIAATWLTDRILHRRTSTAPPRRLPGRRYVAAPGFPQPDATPPLVHREPGQAKAAIDNGPNLWSAVYAPGSLGQRPEPIPDIPGRMTLDDSIPVVTAAIRITRAAAERHQSA